MVIELFLRFKFRGAGVTEVQLLPSVDVHVVVEISLVLEHLLTDFAFYSLTCVLADVS